MDWPKDFFGDFKALRCRQKFDGKVIVKSYFFR